MDVHGHVWRQRLVASAPLATSSIPLPNRPTCGLPFPGMVEELPLLRDASAPVGIHLSLSVPHGVVWAERPPPFGLANLGHSPSRDLMLFQPEVDRIFGNPEHLRDFRCTHLLFGIVLFQPRLFPVGLFGPPMGSLDKLTAFVVCHNHIIQYVPKYGQPQ